MKLERLSIKRLCQLMGAGMVISMLAITAALYVLAQSMVVLLCGGMLTACALGWLFLLVFFFGKRLSVFTDGLCFTLDQMISGNVEPERPSDSETIFARISHRLSRLYSIMQEDRRRMDEERQELQVLVSDISHQVKTPVSSAIERTLAERDLKSETRRNLMVAIAVALAAFLNCFAAVASVSIAQMQRSQVADTYEAVFTSIEGSDVTALKDLPELARVGEYYLLGQVHSPQGYNASYVYCDRDMMYIARGQMELTEGRLPERTDEIAASTYFLTAYGSNAKIGEVVRLDAESFHGYYTVTGVLSGMGEQETDTCVVIVSKAALTGWNGFDPAGYRAYVHFQNDRQMNQETVTAQCWEIAAWHGLPPAGKNSSYFAYYSKSMDFATVGAVAALALAGGHVVIQSMFRISIQDKIQSYGQLRTIGAHIEYEKMQSSIIFGGMQALSWLIFLFGVVDLINTTLSNQMSRKWENSILRSIGQTRKQQCQMNIFEGLCYAGSTILTVFIVGFPLAVVVCWEISKQSFGGKIAPYQFPVLEIGLFTLVLFSMELTLSAWTASRQRKQSLIEQMRETK